MAEVRRNAATFHPEPPGSVTHLLQTCTDLDGADPWSGIERGPVTDRYLFLKEIARGGMGRVVEVSDRDLRRTVAMKLLRLPGTPRRLVEQFLQEAQITAQLEHPGVIPCYDFGMWRVDGEPHLYYTMKRVRGRPLSEVARSGEGLRALLRVLLSACLTIDYAHRQRVIHLDLKPENVMVGDFDEVYVLDWGISRVGAGGTVRTLVTETGATALGERVAGTPGFLAPEMLSEAEVGGAADVYGLGAILYELCAGRAPYSARNLDELRAAMAAGPPPVPQGPEPVVRLLLRALDPRPDARPPSARAMHDALLAYLEGAEDREKRRAEASRLLHDGLEASAAFLGAWREHRAQHARASALRARTPPWLPVEEKQALWTLEDRAEQARHMAQAQFSSAELCFHQALERADDPDARSALADLYYECFLHAEAEGDTREATRFRGLVDVNDDGRYADVLRAEGTLRVESSLPGAAVTLHPWRYDQRRLVPGEAVPLGVTPLFRNRVAPGDYLLVLTLPGHAETRYPIRLERHQDLVLDVRPRRPAQIGEGFVYVPAGPFRAGGDPAAPRSLDAHVEEVPDFVIGRFPVTCAEYLAFLNADPDAHARHAPRWEDPTTSHWPRDGAGAFRIPDEPDRRGFSWRADFPVVEVNWFDATAYCAWRSRVDGRELRLPSELEWEKAARGTDGRYFPWGNHFDATWCNMGASRGDGIGRLGPVGEFPTDASPYGVRDLAGNVLEWTTDRYMAGMAWKVLKGGGWLYEPAFCRVASRIGYDPTGPRIVTGFRLAATLPRGG